MYKRWTINQDNTTNNRIAWMKRFFSGIENILTELGIEFTSRYTFRASVGSSYDCNCTESNLSVMAEKGYPDWVCNFMSFPTLINSLGTDWTAGGSSQNNADGFLAFELDGVKYCFVYAMHDTSNSDNSDLNAYGHLTLLMNLENNNYKGEYQKYKIVVHIKKSYDNNNDTSYFKNGLITYGTTNYILVEYHKNSYMEMLNFTFNGVEAGDNYYGSGKFLSLGHYNIADGMSLRFPSGLACGENVTNEMVNQLCFQTDAEGLLRILNSVDGDLRAKKYLKGNIHYGLKNNTILGKLDNSVTINNYNYPPGTIFMIKGVEYRKIRIPTVHNINFVSKDYSNYGTALSMAFHKEDIADES